MDTQKAGLDPRDSKRKCMHAQKKNGWRERFAEWRPTSRRLISVLFSQKAQKASQQNLEKKIIAIYMSRHSVKINPNTCKHVASRH